MRLIKEIGKAFVFLLNKIGEFLQIYIEEIGTAVAILIALITIITFKRKK